MISTNPFRPLPPPNSISTVSILPDDGDVVATPTVDWPNLHTVHDILLQIINSEPKAVHASIDCTFIISLSEDTREQESLKNMYHEIYSKLFSLRSFMRKTMNDVEQPKNIVELEICGTVINGFSIPLKEQHKVFLMRVSPAQDGRYAGISQAVAYCVHQFVEKEPVLGVVVVKGILRYWPVTNCQKEILLIGELEELEEKMGPEQYKILLCLLSILVTKCMNSWNS